MPIQNSKQRWTVGQTVKVGFLSLTVIGFTPTPGDYRPDTYTLASAKGTRYEFTPHYGLQKLEGLHNWAASPAPVSGTRPSAGRYFRQE